MSGRTLGGTPSLKGVNSRNNRSHNYFKPIILQFNMNVSKG